MTALPIDLGRYLTFMGVMGVMAIAPGTANVFSLAIGAQWGRRAAILAMRGVNSATLGWFALVEWIFSRVHRPGLTASITLLGLGVILLGLSFFRADPLPVLGRWRLDTWAAFGMLGLAGLGTIGTIFRH